MTANNKKSTLTVFVVRHGERLDEALHRERKEVPKEIKIDPPLTPQGHQQAQDAFSRLASGLREDGQQRKIAIFSSPTKRTIGTSLMVLTSSMNELVASGQVEWGMQSATPQDNENSEQVTPVVPITVLNGLGSCAARIARCGGAEAAVRMGHLPCADFAPNDGSPSCPVSMELQNMQRCCHSVAPATPAVTAVRYQKVQQGDVGWVIPIAPPITPHTALPVPPVPKRGYRSVPEHCQQQRSEYFWQALDRAVLLAEEDGCDTLVVVAHREGIREMLDRWGRNGHKHPSRLTYCCISSFIVKVYDDHSCRWCYHGVVDYPDFGVEGVPSKERWNLKYAESNGMK